MIRPGTFYVVAVLVALMSGCAALDQAADAVQDVGQSIDTIVIDTPIGQAIPADWRAGLLLTTTVIGAAAAAYKAARQQQAEAGLQLSDKTLTTVVRAIESEGNTTDIQRLKGKIEDNMQTARIYDAADAKIDQIKAG